MKGGKATDVAATSDNIKTVFAKRILSRIIHK